MTVGNSGQLIELSQCPSCKLQQQKLKIVKFCNLCFNQSYTEKDRKKVYYHNLKSKFENLSSSLNNLIELGVKGGFIEGPASYFGIQGDFDNSMRGGRFDTGDGLGELEALKSYKIPLILLHLEVNSKFNFKETNIYKTYLISELLELFEIYMLPRTTLFLPSKLKKLITFSDKPDCTLLLFAILVKSEFMLKCLNQGEKFSGIDDIINNLYFYKCYKGLLGIISEPSLELVQATLLIADFETGIGLSGIQPSSVKVTKYSQMIYLNDPSHSTHKFDSLETKVEKFLTLANLIVYENKLYFYSPDPSRNCCLPLEINFDHMEELPLEYRKWVEHVKLLSIISVYLINGIQLKSKLKQGYRLSELEVCMVRRIVMLSTTSTLGEIPLKYFTSKRAKFNNYHIAILFQYIFFNTYKIVICDLVSDLVNFCSDQFPQAYKKLLIKQKTQKLKTSKKIIKLATNPSALEIIDNEKLKYLEANNSILSWSYFFSVRTLIAEEPAQLDATTIRLVIEKLEGFVRFWPTAGNKSVVDILKAKLEEGRGISITYYDLNKS